MTPIEADKKRVATDPNYIHLKRFGFSLDKLLERYPEGCPDRIIANALLIPEAEVEALYQQAVRRLRRAMGVHG